MPRIKPVMTVIGAAYILWLAYKTVTASGHAEKDASGSGFSSGVVLQFFNPKAILYGVTSASTFLVPHYKVVSWVMAGLLVYCAVSLF